MLALWGSPWRKGCLTRHITPYGDTRCVVRKKWFTNDWQWIYGRTLRVITKRNMYVWKKERKAEKGQVNVRGQTRYKLLDVARPDVFMAMAIVIMVLTLENLEAVVMVWFVASCMRVPKSHGLTAKNQQRREQCTQSF